MNTTTVRFWEIGDIEGERARQAEAYLEFLRIPSMSAGIYVLPAGSADPQSPHKQDEVYYVIRGYGRLRAGLADQSVKQGSLILVAAGVEHRFHDIEEELTVLVLFAPAESQ